MLPGLGDQPAPSDVSSTVDCLLSQMQARFEWRSAALSCAVSTLDHKL